MSLFDLFKNTKTVASIICIKNESANCYDCKMGFNYEGALIKTNGFKYSDSFCDAEVKAFIKSIGAIDTEDLNDVSRWIFMEKNPNIDIYSFGKSREIHLIKHAVEHSAK